MCAPVTHTTWYRASDEDDEIYDPVDEGHLKVVGSGKVGRGVRARWCRAGEAWRHQCCCRSDWEGARYGHEHRGCSHAFRGAQGRHEP